MCDPVATDSLKEENCYLAVVYQRTIQPLNGFLLHFPAAVTLLTKGLSLRSILHSRDPWNSIS